MASVSRACHGQRECPAKVGPVSVNQSAIGAADELISMAGWVDHFPSRFCGTGHAKHAVDRTLAMVLRI